MNDAKKWWQSKTIIINVLMIFGAVSAMVAEELSNGAGLGVIVINTVNIILRFITGEPIEK